MTNIPSETAVQRNKIAAPPIAEPAEFDPVTLFYQASAKFGWNQRQFAEAFGCEPNTLYTWLAKRRPPNKWVKMHAASLQEKWKRDWGL